MKYRCMVTSVNGRKGTLIDRDYDERTRQLLQNRVIEEYREQRRKRGRPRKSDIQHANPDERVEYK